MILPNYPTEKILPRKRSTIVQQHHPAGLAQVGEGEGGGDPTELSLGPAAPAASGEDDDAGGDGSAVSLSPTAETAEQGSPAAAEDSKAVGRSAAVCSLRPPIARPSLAVFTPFFPRFSGFLARR